MSIRAWSYETGSRTSSCFVALPGPSNVENHGPFNYYIGGLTFLSLNDVHWQCESTVFGNFFECLRAMMAEVGDWKSGDPWVPVLEEYLRSLFPEGDDDRDKFVDIASAFEARVPESVIVTLKEASFAKLFCDAYFMSKFRPAALAKKIMRREGPPKSTDDGPPS